MDAEQLTDIEKLGQWIVPYWQDDPLYVVCWGVTLFCILWAVLEKTGLIVQWLPKRITLAEALQQRKKASHGSYKVDVGLEWVERIEAIAQKRFRAGIGVDQAQYWLAKLYDPLPFSPKALDRALTYAVIYTLALWLIPWLAGASGKLGQATVLPNNLSIVERSAILVPLLLIEIYIVLKLRHVISVWINTILFLGAVAAVSSISAAAYSAGSGAMAIAGTIAIAIAIAISDGSLLIIGISNGVVASLVASAILNTGSNSLSYALTYALVGGTVHAYCLKNALARASATMVWYVRLGWSFFQMLPLVLLLIVPSCLPNLLNEISIIKFGRLSVENLNFALLFFIGWLPIVNAAFDFISVSLTQVFLTHMQRGQWTLWWWLADALSAVLLVLGLYWLVLGLLYALQAIGWGVDPHAIIQQFRSDPYSVSWLLLLALTNILPTLLHWVLGLAGLFTDYLGPKARFAKQWAQQVIAGQPLGRIDAESFADYLLFGYRWFSFCLALCLLAWSIWVFRWGLLHSLQWLA